MRVDKVLKINTWNGSQPDWDSVCRRLDAFFEGRKQLIALCGAPGSGKTTMRQSCLAHLPTVDVANHYAKAPPDLAGFSLMKWAHNEARKEIKTLFDGGCNTVVYEACNLTHSSQWSLWAWANSDIIDAAITWVWVSAKGATCKERLSQPGVPDTEIRLKLLEDISYSILAGSTETHKPDTRVEVAEDGQSYKLLGGAIAPWHHS